MARVVRKWAPTKRTGPRGDYWSLRAGRDQERVSLSLGYVPADLAAIACARMNEAEVCQRAGRILEWHKESRDEALAWLFSSGEVEVEVPLDFGAMRLEDYFNDAYKEWRAAKRPAGWKQEERVWRRVNEGIGAVRVRDVDAHVVADYLDGLVALKGQRKGKPASGTTRRLHRAAIQALLKRAFRLKHLAELPDLAVFQIEGATKRVIAKPDPLNLEELNRLMKVSEPKYRAMWAVAAGQGLRPSELNRIRWEDVDFDVRTLRVRGTKTEASDATVPLTPLAYRELFEWWFRCGQPIGGLAFPARGGGMYGNQGWKKALKAAAKKAKIKRRVYPYLMRDSFATIAWAQGIPMDLARRVMRHEVGSRVLEAVYCRPRAADLAKAMAGFDLRS
jgi:integrase